MARHKRISTVRDRRSFRRLQGKKPPRSITLIACEGESERVYLDEARIKYGLTNAEVVLAKDTKGSAPITVVEYAEKKAAEPGGYDGIFCVFDRDSHESFERARNRIRSLANRKRQPLAIEEAISIPCFEIWVLLHFERRDAPFAGCDEVNRLIRVQHLPDYRKADAKISRQIVESVSTAIANADWLEARAEQNAFNPYTSVHHVLRHFENVAKQEYPV